MKTWRLVVEVDSCPEMGWPENLPDQQVLETVEQALQDGGFDNDMSARVRLQSVNDDGPTTVGEMARRLLENDGADSGDYIELVKLVARSP